MNTMIQSPPATETNEPAFAFTQPIAISTAHLRVEGEARDRYDEILTPEALSFLTELHQQFAGERGELMRRRMVRGRELANGRDLGFRPETAHIREDRDWRVAGAGPGLHDRRVEITGPTDRKMTINAMNSGAKVWLADHEDAMSPTWANVIGGQISLVDAIRRRIDFDSPEGKRYALNADVLENGGPTIVMRPRGLHLVERHLTFVNRSGQRMAASASFVDYGLYVFHNAHALIEQGHGPYFYLPKLESAREARLWDRVFSFTEEYLDMQRGTIRATVLIETIPAAFEMEEILFELREHCAGLNAGRWDYIFSLIKNFRERGPRFVLPDRKQITMTVPFMRAYTELLVQTCHARGAHAIGGMSAFIPNRREPAVTRNALAQVAADKRREAGDGFDGTWVAHPDLIETARAEFDAVLGSRPNQLGRLREDVSVSAADLLDVGSAEGTVTDLGVRDNVRIALKYIEAWLRGLGAVAIDDLMEDAATAEISRSQLWQWVRNGTVTAEGTTITRAHVDGLITEIADAQAWAPDDRFHDAAEILREVSLAEDFATFLTIGAYARHFAN
ncbi:malate synthase A [Microbacteriaceae bacterium VKM Ac-2854]|nr:malate synthase A [Microbacteriaceae bacterium VKM Ac-2854]